jgi:hypothetical protein
MPSTYVKRIWVQKKVSVYVVVRDSVQQAYRVVEAKRVRAEMSSKNAALQFAHQLLLGEQSRRHEDERFVEQAAGFSPGIAFTEALDPRFLAALEVKRLDADGRDDARKEVAILVGVLASEAGSVPAKAHLVEEWIPRVFGAVTRPVSRQITSRGTVKVRVQTFLRLLAHIEVYSIAFRAWSETPGLVRSRLKSMERLLAKEKDREESFAPYSRADAERMATTEDFRSFCRCLVYLSGGFRAGEGDRFSSQHLVDDRVNLESLVTKVRTTRMPKASIVLRVAS